MKNLILIAIIVAGTCFCGYGQTVNRRSDQKVTTKTQKKEITKKQLKSLNPALIKKIDIPAMVTDKGGNVYKTVKIGEQVWMAENLAYLPKLNASAGGTSTEPSYYVYNYNGALTEAKLTGSYKTYGVLYNWAAALISCPTGWHLPTNMEWEELAQYINSQKGPYNKSGDKWNQIGKHLKAASGWYNNGTGTDDFEFTALPGGSYNYGGHYSRIGNYGFWWTASESGSGKAWYRYMADNNDASLYQADSWNNYGFSVRCIKD